MAAAMKSRMAKKAVENEEFIEEIRKHPILYDGRMKEYKDALMKDNDWTSIGEKFRLSRDDAAAKWKGLRDRFIKERKAFHLKATKSGSGSKDVVKPKWKLYVILEGFLEPTVAHRETTSNLEDQSVIGDNSETSTQEFPSYEPTRDPQCSTSSGTDTDFNCDNNVHPSHDVTDSSRDTDVPAKKRKSRESGIDKEVVNILQKATTNLEQLLPNSNSQVQKQSESFHYFRSLERRFEKLSESDQIEVRFKFEQILFEKSKTNKN